MPVRSPVRYPASAAIDLPAPTLWLHGGSDTFRIDGPNGHAPRLSAPFKPYGLQGAGPTIASLADLSGNSPGATTTTGDRPTVTADAINGKSALRFDGTADYATVASAGELDSFDTGGCWVLMVFRAIDVDSGDERLFSFGTGSNIFDVTLRGTVGSNSQLGMLRRWSNTGVWNTTSREIAHGTPYVADIAYDSGDLANVPTITVNGNPKAVTTATAPTGTITATTGDLTLGAYNTPSNYFEGDFGDLIIFATEPSEAEKGAWREFVAHCWGIW